MLWFIGMFWIIFFAISNIIETTNNSTLAFVRSLFPVMPYLVTAVFVLMAVVEIALLKRLSGRQAETAFFVRSVVSFLIAEVTFALIVGGLVYTTVRDMTGDYLFMIVLIGGGWLYWIVAGWIKCSLYDRDNPGLAFAGNIIIGAAILFFYIFIPSVYDKSLIASFVDMMTFSL